MEESPAKEDARPHILNNFQQDKTISQCVEWISANNIRDRKVLSKDLMINDLKNTVNS